MRKLLKDTVKITNDNIILATPLIFFMWILSLYIGFSRMTVNSLALALLSFVTILFMTGAFFAGWFYMVKNAVKLAKQVFVFDADRAKATFNLLKTIPSGIGQYFLPFLGMIIFSFVLIAIVGTAVFHLGIHFIGKLDLDPTVVKNILNSSSDMKTFLDSLSFEQLIKLNNWNLLFLSVSSLMSFLFMLWIPEIVYQTKNPFLALFKSIRKIFAKPWKAVKLFIFMSVLNFVLSFINTFSIINPFLYFVMMIVYFYFLVYMVVLIFSYYDREFE